MGMNQRFGARGGRPCFQPVAAPTPLPGARSRGPGCSLLGPGRIAKAAVGPTCRHAKRRVAPSDSPLGRGKVQQADHRTRQPGESTVARAKTMARHCKREPAPDRSLATGDPCLLSEPRPRRALISGPGLVMELRRLGHQAIATGRHCRACAWGPTAGDRRPRPAYGRSPAVARSTVGRTWCVA